MKGSQQTWSDAVAIKGILRRHLDSLSYRLLFRPLGIQSGSKPSRSLLVHLGSRSNAVDGHEEELLGLDLTEQMLYITKDGDEHLIFGQAKSWRVGILVGTIVNDAIHIQLRQKRVSSCPVQRPNQAATYIEAIELWYPVLRNELRDCRIPFAEPSEEFGNSHGQLN